MANASAAAVDALPRRRRPHRPTEPRVEPYVSRRAAWTLIALCAWTLWVWITRMWIIAGQDQSMGFKVVHTILAVEVDRLRPGRGLDRATAACGRPRATG